jgi:hypothetical protein
MSTLKNIATALTASLQYTLNINGAANHPAITTATVVKTSAGRICSVSVIVAGSAGHIYDSAVLGVTTKPLYVIPATVGIIVVNMPAAFGILVVPGSGQTVSVSYS